jgi:hypothetical protein
VSPWSDEAEQLKDLDACNVPYALETFQKKSRLEKRWVESFLGGLKTQGHPGVHKSPKRPGDWQVPCTKINVLQIT